jgi:hypothetical protein
MGGVVGKYTAAFLDRLIPGYGQYGGVRDAQCCSCSYCHKDRTATAHKLLLQIDQVFCQHAIAIPFPQQDVRLRSVDATLVISPMSNGHETVAAHTELPARGGQ